MARLSLLAVVALLVACGSSAKHTSGPGPGHVLYQGTQWAVVLDHGKATAETLVDGDWRPASSTGVRIDVLGPKPGSKQPATPQVAVQLRATDALADSALWVDGVEVLTKGGGTSPRVGTIYGAPGHPLAAGSHTAVAYVRTATHAAAVAWTFRV